MRDAFPGRSWESAKHKNIKRNQDTWGPWKSGLVDNENQESRPTERKVESGTSQSKSGSSVNLSNSGIYPHVVLGRVPGAVSVEPLERAPVPHQRCVVHCCVRPARKTAF